jgi:hypothetical protein
LVWSPGGHGIEAVERGFGGDRRGFAGDGEAVLGDIDVEMLGHVAAVDDGAGLAGEPGDAAQWPPGAPDRLADRGEIALGGLEQILALGRRFGR